MGKGSSQHSLLREIVQIEEIRLQEGQRGYHLGNHEFILSMQKKSTKAHHDPCKGLRLRVEFQEQEKLCRLQGYGSHRVRTKAESSEFEEVRFVQDWNDGPLYVFQKTNEKVKTQNILPGPFLTRRWLASS